MGNYASVNPLTSLLTASAALPYLHHWLFTFVPSTTTFADGFDDSEAAWMIQSPTTNLGAVAELTKDTWSSRLKALGAETDEPVYRAASAHFSQLLAAKPDNTRDAIDLPDVLYVGRRTRAAASRMTVTFGTNTAGTVRVRINRAKYIETDADPTGALADVTITADGVDAVADLATDLAAALNAITGFADKFAAAAALGVVTVTGDTAGYPLEIDVTPSTPGPTMTVAVTTANVAGNYELDLNDLQTAAELGTHLDPPARRYYWITDLQRDDVVNLEMLEWAKDQADTDLHNPPRDYLPTPHSVMGSAVVTRTGAGIGNFNAAATASLSQAAASAVGGEGYERGFIIVQDRMEYIAPAIGGRVVGYLPGEASFTSKVLYGSTAASRMTPREWGDLEYLAGQEERRFSYYSAEGARGSLLYGATPRGGWVDQIWLKDYATYLIRLRLVEWMQRRNIVAYINDDIEAMAKIAETALAELPAVTASTIRVTFLTREQVDPADISARIYRGLAEFADTNGVINRIGTLAEPFPISLKDAG
jgi:hypothetical protein